MNPRLDALAAEEYCYLTTTGRRTGRPHEIEIWFAMERATVYMLAGGGLRSDWVRNAIEHPGVSVRIADLVIAGTARRIEDAAEEAAARRTVFEKYQPGSDDDLTSWRGTALPVAVDLEL